MTRLILVLPRLLDGVAALAMLALLIVTSLNIFSRAILSRPIAGALESSMLLMPIIVFGGMAWVFARVGHFAMTSFVNRQGKNFRLVAFTLNCILSAAVFVFLSIEGVNLFNRSFARAEFFAGPVNIPVYYSRLMIAVGSIATVVSIIVVLLPEGIRRIRGDSDLEVKE